MLKQPLSVGLACLGALVLLMFMDVLIAPGTKVLGHASTDVFRQFLSWREFGFREFAAGNVPLWNPHIFGGAPYHGGMQAALFYPLNSVFLALPIAAALNWSVALNVWLLGSFMYLWGLRRQLNPLAAFAAAALLMFCAPFFLRIYAGHLANLAAMVWVPLLFLAIDEWLRTARKAWCLAGALAVGMQILAGHPQYVYFTAIAAGGYVAMRWVGQLRADLKSPAGVLGMYAGGALLAAVQLLPGLQAIGETVRQQPLPYSLASTFAFPPENLLTLVAPAFFGDGLSLPYWGRWYLWEMSLFMGVVGFSLAAYGMAVGRFAGKQPMLILIVALFVLALGSNTPLYLWLYEHAPGFDRFRSLSKFIFLCTVFLAFFAGVGLDRLLTQGGLTPQAVRVAAGAVITLFVCAMVVRWLDWQAVMQWVLSKGESYLDVQAYRDAALVQRARAMASIGLLLGGITLGAALGLATRLRAGRVRELLLVGLIVGEVFLVARLSRATFDANLVTAELPTAVRRPAEHRIINLHNANSAMSTGGLDVWGYDPGVTRRYAELITWSEGSDPSEASQYVNFERFHPLLSMLRARFVVVRAPDGLQAHEARLEPLRRLELLGLHRTARDKAEVLQALSDPSFDPRREVVLEADPYPVPVPVAFGGQGQARILAEGTDFLDIEARVVSPSILLVTDAWTPSWEAKALAGSVQAEYQVVPANYALRGIPLLAGSHRLRLEYSPRYLSAGAWISALSWLVFLITALIIMRHRHA